MTATDYFYATLAAQETTGATLDLSREGLGRERRNAVGSVVGPSNATRNLADA